MACSRVNITFSGVVILLLSNFQSTEDIFVLHWLEIPLLPFKTGFHPVRRDALYRLSLRGLTQLEKAPWLAPPEKVELCQNKGQAETSCHNFVKVLLANGKRVFTCGTNAFSPQCSWREVSVLTNM